MAKQVKLRRGTTAEHADFVGANGEVTVDTVKHVVVVHDGVTAGGWPVANATAVDATLSVLTANAANQAASITTLLANAATQAVTLTSLAANAAAQQAGIDAFILASNATAIFANIAGVQANVTAANAAILLLQGNAVVQSEAIALANANIIALQSTVANIVVPNLQAVSSQILPTSYNTAISLGSSTNRWRSFFGGNVNLMYAGGYIETPVAYIVPLGGNGVTDGGLHIEPGVSEDPLQGASLTFARNNIDGNASVSSRWEITQNATDFYISGRRFPAQSGLAVSELYGNVELYNSINLNANANISFTDSSTFTTANVMLMPFTMANVTHWTANVDTIGAALNQLAERIYNIENP